MEFTILLMPKFNSTRKEMGFEENEDYDSDAVRWQQGYNIQQMTIEPGEKFTIGRKWESASLQCEGNMIKLISKNDWDDDDEEDEQINLTSGNYFFNEDGSTIEKLSELDNDDSDDDEEVEQEEF